MSYFTSVEYELKTICPSNAMLLVTFDKLWIWSFRFPNWFLCWNAFGSLLLHLSGSSFSFTFCCLGEVGFYFDSHKTNIFNKLLDVTKQWLFLPIFSIKYRFCTCGCTESGAVSDVPRIWDEFTPTNREPCVVSRSINCLRVLKSPNVETIFRSGLVLCKYRKEKDGGVIHLSLENQLESVEIAQLTRIGAENRCSGSGSWWRGKFIFSRSRLVLSLSSLRSASSFL